MIGKVEEREDIDGEDEYMGAGSIMNELLDCLDSPLDPVSRNNAEQLRRLRRFSESDEPELSPSPDCS